MGKTKIFFDLFLKKIKPLSFLIILQFLLFEFNRPNYIYSLEIDKKPTTEYLEKIPSNNFYILGTGDKLSIKVTDKSSLLNSVSIIDGEGLLTSQDLKKFM